ncbi:MAG: hypothetical protein ACOYJB_04485 [Christensenellaceae bacterium]|jgi:hypothetical protein
MAGKIPKWKMDPHKVYSLPLHHSFKELCVFWFRKKICPDCGAKMAFTPDEVHKGEGRLGGPESSSAFTNPRQAYDLYYFYTCEQCNKCYSLEMLTVLYGEMKQSK